MPLGRRLAQSLSNGAGAKDSLQSDTLVVWLALTELS